MKSVHLFSVVGGARRHGGLLNHVTTLKDKAQKSPAF